MKFTYIILLFISFCFPKQIHATTSAMEATTTIAAKLSIVPVPKTQETKQQLINELLEKQQVFETRMYVLVTSIVVLVLVFGLLCFLNKKSDARLQKIMKLLESNHEEKTKEDENHLDIDPTIVTTILYELQQFEKERGFLISKITLHQFAKTIQTNTKYLSKVINTHKLKSFRNYINDLRIQYSIEKLKNNNNYKKYTVKAMAEEAGFGTVNSFSKAFQKRTGETVSGFLKQQTDSELV